MTAMKKSENADGICRREFICKSAMICSLAGLPLVKGVTAKEAKSRASVPKEKLTEMASYCGLYCGACDIYQKRFSKAGNELKKLLDAYDFKSISKQIPGLEGYDTFYKVLNTIIFFFGQCFTCRKNGGNPQCQIRICAREKGYTTCAECPEFVCDKLKIIVDGYSEAEENLIEIKKIGLGKWCQKQQEKVDHGFRYTDQMIKEKKKN
ncbi:MAG: DUF3795 domain-containing protein [Candidatus Aminicenantes bacterium]|nr:DUF3795 domain-containing protein [Candidatus Aminicenantes bacterium]